MTYKSLIILMSCFILKQALVAQIVPPPATQTEVNAGVNRFKYVTPYTFANSTVAAATAAGKQQGSFILTNFIAMGITNIVSANANTVLTTNNGVLTITTASGSGSLTTNANQFGASVVLTLKDGTMVTNLVVDTSITLNGAGTTPGEVQLFGTNDVPVVTRAANSNSVALTNIVGVLHKAYASVVVLDCNHGSRFMFTNRAATANTTLVLTNLAQGQEVSVSMLGEASGGTSRTVTIVPHLGYLVSDLDAFGVAMALNKTVTLTNGNGLEFSAAAKWEIGTNFCDIVTRQYLR